MTDFNSWFFTSWSLCFLAICKGSDVIVQNFEGDTVTLPCKYDSKYHGKCEICWMRGDIPNMGCGDEIIGSDGDKVVRKKSNRYSLAGQIQHGDVSLTIYNIDKTDSGKYGCRIHVPGWFNDEMHYVHLIVEDALIPTTRETTSMLSSTSTHQTTGVTTASTEAPGPTEPEPVLTTFSGRLTSESQTTETSGEKNRTTEQNTSSVSLTEAPKSSTIGLWTTETTSETSVSGYFKPSSGENKDTVNVSVVVVPILLLLLAVTAIFGILIWKHKKKTRDAIDIVQNSDISVIYSNSGSTVGLYNRETAVENVYQIQPENEYEQWH